MDDLMEEIEDPLIDNAYFCPLCGGPSYLLGKLSQQGHMRCRMCEMRFNHEEEE